MLNKQLMKRKPIAALVGGLLSVAPQASILALGFAAMVTVSTGSQAADTAKEPAAKAEAAAIEEVIVTARKREENIQSVPVAITALSTEALRENAVQTLEDMRFHAPALQISPSPFGASVPGISIRGQRQLEALITLDPAVGVYFADVVLERPHGVNASMCDLQSVQVLKGPQGTLFGRNTTGGAVLISPNKPSFEGVGGYAEVTVGNYNTINLSAMVNVPVSDTVALRFAMQTDDHDAYTRNLYPGAPNKDNLHDQSFRASMTVKPTTDIESTTVFQNYHTKSDGGAWRIAGVNPKGAIAGFPGVVNALTTALQYQNTLDWHTVVNDQKLGEDVETNHLSNTTTWQLNDITLKNIIGWHTVRSFSAFDYDGSGVPLSTTAPSGTVTIFNSKNNLNAHQFSDEFQVLGNALNKRLDWITGVYYFREVGDDIQRSDLFGRRINSGTGENKSKSVFAQGTYKFESVENLSLTAGARKTWDDRSVDQHQQLEGLAATTFSCRLTSQPPPPAVYGAPGIPLNPCDRFRTYQDSAPTWDLSLDYAFTPDTLAYVARRHGYKSGGLQLRANAYTEPATFNPEFVNDWELGLKSTFDVAGMPVRANAALFNQDYTDIQRTVSVQIPSGLVTTVLNAGSATIKGAELELTVLPMKGLELTMFLDRTDASYNSFLQAKTGGGFQDVSASSFSMIPKNVAGASFKYELPLPSDIGKVSVRTNWYRQSLMEITDINVINGVRTGEGQIPGYALADAFLDWSSVMNSPFDARLYVKNLGDTKYATGGTTVISTGFYSYTLGAPRTYGFELRYRFGTEK